MDPPIKYIKGPKNIVANVLSRLDLVSLPSNVQDMVDCYGLDKDDLYQVMLFQSPTNLSIVSKTKIKLFLLPLNKVQSTIRLKSFMGAGPHDCYVTKTGL